VDEAWRPDSSSPSPPLFTNPIHFPRGPAVGDHAAPPALPSVVEKPGTTPPPMAAAPPLAPAPAPMPPAEPATGEPYGRQLLSPRGVSAPTAKPAEMAGAPAPALPELSVRPDEVAPKRPTVRTIRRPLRKEIDIERLRTEAVASRNISVTPAEETPLSIDEEISKSSKSSLWPWVAAGAAFVALLLLGSYFLMDRWTSHSAIVAATRRAKKAPIAVPVAPEIPVPKISVPPAPISRVEPETAPIAPPAPAKPLAPPAPRSVFKKKRAVKPMTKPVIEASPPSAPAFTVKPLPKSVRPAPQASLPAPATSSAGPAQTSAASTAESVQQFMTPAVVTPPLAVTAPAAAAPLARAQTQAPAKDGGQTIPAPAQSVPDIWANRQNEAITAVMNQGIVNNKGTVASQAKALLDQMHDKELLHAAEKGERLYLPDKTTWTALHQEKSLYRVYLDFSALQANGERTQTRSYQFLVDLATHRVSSDDMLAQQTFLNAPTLAIHQHNQRALDIDQLLSAVDFLDKHKMRAIIVRKSRSNKTELLNLESSLKGAQAKLRRMIFYFRSQYDEKMLQNVAKAYNFAALLQG
jgi:hypothetical protein